MYRFLILALMLGSVGQLHAQTTAQEIVDAARQACTEMDSGEFSVSDDAVKHVDLDGDGTKDILVDEGKFACSTSATLFSPTGGAQLHAIVGDNYDVWMAQAWRLMEWGEDTILLMAQHGSQCGGYGYQHCYEAIVWSDEGAMTVRGEEDAIDG
jgi:hypothetical protein